MLDVYPSQYNDGNCKLKVNKCLLHSHCNLKYIQNRTVHTFCTVPSNRVRTVPHRFDLCSAVSLNVPFFSN